MLLELARHTIRDYLAMGMLPVPPAPDRELAEKRGCFVTLRKAGGLRGCVGTFDASQPLSQNVIRMAIAAAFQDRRFVPVSKDELAALRIEISVLGRLEKVGSLEDIALGRHGVYIRSGERSGTYLPDVAVQQKWSVAEFVMNCAREKAGLKPEEIARAEIYRYDVESFVEE